MMQELNERISNKDDETRSDNVFFAKSRKMRGRVVDFIGEVHGRRSDASIRDINQPRDNMCHAP